MAESRVSPVRPETATVFAASATFLLREAEGLADSLFRNSRPRHRGRAMEGELALKDNGWNSRAKAFSFRGVV